MKAFPRMITAAMMLLAGLVPLLAGNPAGREGSARLSVGIEWGYDATLADIFHQNYLHPYEGYRIDKKGLKAKFYPNAHAAASLTFGFAKKYAVGLHAGYSGIDQGVRHFPLSLRATYFMDSYMTDGQFVFLEGGAGFRDNFQKISPLGRLGYGYRISLSRRWSLDLSGSLRAVYDHPTIYDQDIRAYIDTEDVRRSDSVYMAAILSIGLNF